MKLDELTRESIISGPVPMDELLKDSLFYPASRTDGRPIKLCNTSWRRLGVNSFVYCDFDLSVGEFLADTRTMHGYHVLAHRRLAPSEYVPQGWRLEMVSEGHGGRRGYFDSFLGQGGPEHGACWVVFERDADISPVHGPERLSVLYVCGEGLATFQQLYCSRGIAPKMVCFIQCWGFAGNWTDFSAVGAPFHRTLLKYRGCVPEWLCFGDCCGIHGAVRLRDLGYAGVRLLGYRTHEWVRRVTGKGLSEEELDNGREALAWSTAGRRFAAVSVSHHMEYAVYEITHSRLDFAALLDWLVLKDEGPQGPEAGLHGWAGIRGLGEDGEPVLDEKLEWRFLDRFQNIAKAMAVVRSVKEIYSGGKVMAYTPLLKGAMTWAMSILQPASQVRLENGLPSLQRNIARLDAEEWFGNLPSYRPTVNVNIGFGRQ